MKALALLLSGLVAPAWAGRAGPARRAPAVAADLSVTGLAFSPATLPVLGEPSSPGADIALPPAAEPLSVVAATLELRPQPILPELAGTLSSPPAEPFAQEAPSLDAGPLRLDTAEQAEEPVRRRRLGAPEGQEEGGLAPLFDFEGVRRELEALGMADAGRRLEGSRERAERLAEALADPDLDPAVRAWLASPEGTAAVLGGTPSAPAPAADRGALAAVLGRISPHLTLAGGGKDRGRRARATRAARAQPGPAGRPG